jgi:hypothetical protein
MATDVGTGHFLFYPFIACNRLYVKLMLMENEYNTDKNNYNMRGWEQYGPVFI